MNTTEKSHSICRPVIHYYGQCVSTEREIVIKREREIHRHKLRKEEIWYSERTPMVRVYSYIYI